MYVNNRIAIRIFTESGYTTYQNEFRTDPLNLTWLFILILAIVILLIIFAGPPIFGIISVKIISDAIETQQPM